MSRDYTSEAESAISSLGIDLSKESFTADDLARGIKIEYEHGRENTRTNVTDDDPLQTAKIALAHLFEEKTKYRGTSFDAPSISHPKPLQNYDYYDGLELVEAAPPGTWRYINSAYKNGYLYVALIILLVLILTFALNSSFGPGVKLITIIAAVFIGYHGRILLPNNKLNL